MLFFCFNATQTTDIYTYLTSLSLPAALPIWMHQDRRAHVGGGLEEREQLRRVEVPSADMRADLHALQAELVDAALQLLHRQPRRLHRHGADAGVVARVRAQGFGHVVVDRKRQRLNSSH